MITEVLRTPLPLPSCPLMADSAIPKAVSPIHDLRAREFDIMTPIEVEVRPERTIRRRLTLDSSGTLEWPASGFRDDRHRLKQGGEAEVARVFEDARLAAQTLLTPAEGSVQ